MLYLCVLFSNNFQPETILPFDHYQVRETMYLANIAGYEWFTSAGMGHRNDSLFLR